MTLEEGSKVKSDDIKRFPAHDFLYVGLPSQTCTTNNKQVISTFKFGFPRLTLKKGSKVKALFMTDQKTSVAAILFFQNEAKYIPSQDFMVMNISCKFEKASYNIFFVRTVMVKSLHTAAAALA